MLADLVHHIRSELTPSQLLRTVYIYSRNLHDATLAPSIQTMCGKLLLNLIDCIIKIPNREEGKSQHSYHATHQLIWMAQAETF